MGCLPAEFLQSHRVLPALLDACVTSVGRVDLSGFNEFRRRLLRHVAIEELVLMPALTAGLGHRPAFQNGLRRDHLGLVSLCVSAPSAEWLENLRGLLSIHHRLEEEPGGFYAMVDSLWPDDGSVSRRIAALPELRLPALQSGRGTRAALQQLLVATGLADGRAP